MTAAKPKKVKEKFLGEKRHSCRFLGIRRSIFSNAKNAKETAK